MRRLLAIGVLAVMMAGCGDAGKGTKDAPFSTASNGFGMNLFTIKHDGHLWITRDKGGIVHHPDCPCMKKDENGKK